MSTSDFRADGERPNEDVAVGVDASLDPRERALRDGNVRIHPDTGHFYDPTSWSAVDLEPFKRGEKVIEPPKFLTRTDGKALVYPGRPHVFYGASESLKTWAALLACRTVVDAGYRVVYVDMEGSEPSFVERARLTGIKDGYIGDALKYIRPTEPLLDEQTRSDFWLHELKETQPSLIVLDGVTELYALQGWDVNKAEHAALFQKTFAFHRAGVASIAIDHTSKEAGRGQLGSQHKRAGLDGAEYEFKSLVCAGRGAESSARVFVRKDRHGHVREWAGVGTELLGVLRVNVPDGADRVVLEPPDRFGFFDPKSDAQDRALEFIREHPGCSKRAVKDGAGLGDDQAGEALAALEFQGKIKNKGSLSRHKWEAADA